MVKKSKGQIEVEGSGGGLLPAVDGHNLGTRYKTAVVERVPVTTSVLNVRDLG